MIFPYDCVNGNRREHAWLYQFAFPDRRLSSHPNFSPIYICVAEAVSVALENMYRGSPITTKNTLDRVSETIQVAAHVS